MNTFSTSQLLGALASLHQPPRFLLDRFFPNVVNFDTKEVSFDLEDDDLHLAPFVSPVVAGKAEKAKGFETKSFTPAYVKPKNQIDPNMPLIRRPGEQYAGTMTAGERRIMAINETLRRQRERIIRRKEWMAAQALITGKVIVEGDDYPKQEVNFGRASGHNITLTSSNRWGESGVKPGENLDAWMDTVAEAVGAGCDLVVMGKKAWQLLTADDAFMKMLNRDYGQSSLVELGYQTGMPGTPQYKGKAGDVELVTYNGTYKDEEGVTQKILGDYDVLVAATGAHNGFQLNGAIMDGTAGYQPFEYFPKNWIENDPAVEFVMMQSAPLVAPGRPDAILRVKVR